MTKVNFIWPTIDDYDLAMQDRTRTAQDKDIRKGKLAEDIMGIKRYGGANLYSCLYRVDNWIVRCFYRSGKRRPPDDIGDRYREISRFSLATSNETSPLLPIHYIERGLTVDYIDAATSTVERTEVVPIVKMPFIEAPSLGAFIERNYEDHTVMEHLTRAWLQMIRELERIQIAHGDLDLTNVKVRKQGNTITLKLIDYDNVWLPALKDRLQTEFGHAPFQHPEFIKANTRPYNATMDRFSALVMYISLAALTARPQLYKEWGADEVDHLLLSKADYESEIHASETSYYTRRIPQLKRDVPTLAACIDELCLALHNRRRPDSLDSILRSTSYRPDLRDGLQETIITNSLPMYDYGKAEKIPVQGSSPLPPLSAPQAFLPSHPQPSSQQQIPITPPQAQTRGRRTPLWIIGIALVIILITLFILLSHG
jgi:hypothetical protein